MEKKNYIISGELLQNLIKYLGTRPSVETAQGWFTLQQLPEVEEPEE